MAGNVWGEGRRHLATWISRLRRETLKDRLHRVRANLVLALQAGIAAALAWTIAHELIGSAQPVFAPIAAVGTLAASVGQRLRRTAELVFGVSLGIAAADVLILTLGTGPWQLGLIVILAIVVSVFLGAGPGGVTQAAATAVLVAVLTPSDQDLEYSRVIDATVGGVVGLAVITLLLPLNPLRVVERAARPALDMLASQLDATANALRRGDAPAAQHALDRLQELQERIANLQDALSGGRETATLAPVRWHRRAALTQYVESAEYIEYAVGDSGALVRRAITALEDEEPIPESLAVALELLAESVRLLHRELGAGQEPEESRGKALEAVAAAGRAYGEGVGFSGSVVVAQVRTTASDLIRATGVERIEANKLVRRAVGSNHGAETEAVGETGEAPAGSVAARDRAATSGGKPSPYAG